MSVESALEVVKKAAPVAIIAFSLGAATVSVNHRVDLLEKNTDSKFALVHKDLGHLTAEVAKLDAKVDKQSADIQKLSEQMAVLVAQVEAGASLLRCCRLRC